MPFRFRFFEVIDSRRATYRRVLSVFAFGRDHILFRGPRRPCNLPGLPVAS